MAELQVPPLFDRLLEHARYWLPRLEAKRAELQERLRQEGGTREPDPSIPPSIAQLFAQMRDFEQEHLRLWLEQIERRLLAYKALIKAIEDHKQRVEQLNREVIPAFRAAGIELVPAQRRFNQPPAFKTIVLPNGWKLHNLEHIIAQAPGQGAVPTYFPNLFASEDSDPSYGVEILEHDNEALLDEERFMQALTAASAPAAQENNDEE